MTNSLGLKLTVEAGAGRVIVIPPTGAIIGRHPPAEVLLDEPAVSRQHCSIYPHRNQWLVEDLGSQNGTLVNGVPISKQVLRPGDRIQVGGTVLRVPRSMLKPVIAVVATAAGLLAVVFVWHWVAARPASVAAAPEPVTEAKSTSATTSAAAGSSSEFEITDDQLLHPGLKHAPR